MKIKIKLFAILKERIGKEEFDLELSEAKSSDAILSDLATEFHEVASVLNCSSIAVNGILSHRYFLLADGDELAILPPVSGG